MRKALLIGINSYENSPLNCCVNDVYSVSKALSKNYDSSVNFSVRTLVNEEATRERLRQSIKELFNGEGEIALLYFSGHGVDDNNDGVIVSSDYQMQDLGIRMSEVLNYANSSNFRYKIIVLDCCHSGFFGSYGLIGDKSILADGVIIMTASKKNEVSIEVNGHGIFTNLFIEALSGGAADILGRITPGSIYSYIDQALGPWQQRPLFKANISSFVNLKQCKPSIELVDLKTCLRLFKKPDELYHLNPSYEKTNYYGSEHRNCEPYAVSENVLIFTKLQKLNRFGIIIPVEREDMYFAAMDNKSCKLTPLGMHYWQMINEEIL